jgi:archaellin
MKKKLLVILCIATMLATIGLVSGAYLMTSNHLSHNSSAQVQIVLTQNATSSVVGIDTVRLIATQASLTGTVTFYDGATSLGTATATGGVATFDFPITTAKTWDFNAQGNHS